MGYKQLFYDAVFSIDVNIENLPAKKTYNNNGERNYYKAPSKETVENYCKKISDVLVKDFGGTSAEYILRGLKKSLLTMPYNEIKLRNYQQQIITETCTRFDIEL